jgi:hypothetical protein
MLLEFLFALAWKLPLAFIGLSLMEWAIHKYLLHGRWVYKHIPFLRFIYRWHAIEHHGQGLKQNYPHINLSLIDYWFAWSIAGFGLWRFFLFGYVEGLAGAVAVISMSLGHMFFWNALHHSIHELGKPNWITKLPWFSAFATHHLNHHKDVRTNFGVVCIWIDFHLGTLYRQTKAKRMNES